MKSIIFLSLCFSFISPELYSQNYINVTSHIDIKAGMTFSIQYNKKTNKYTPWIKIPIELNRDSDIYNHYWNIVNSFEHEKQHYRDFKVWGIEKYKSHSKSEKEKRAISYQYNHYSYQYTTVEFQRGIKAYWKSKK